ncbi:MAG: alanine--glyoxylate aminotransferase family protein [Bdellovibrio sp.]|nr:MAG: alanine--glyoxylate aminotransferase family protein [Bdellovibrio sp.]
MQPKEAAPTYNVLAPGPVNLHPQVQETLAWPMIHHRTPEFDAVLSRVLKGLRKVFATSQPCYVLTSTGSGGMEALLVNILSPGEKVVVVDSGKFGERWSEMAGAYGAQVIPIKVPWGQAVDAAAVAAILKQQPASVGGEAATGGVRAVLCQACETSTGVVHPIQELGRLISSYPDTLFLVDGITALGAFPLPMDEWHIDGLVGGSQKAFMLPTGLSLISFSAKAWRVIPQAKCPRYYFDIRLEHQANQKGETFFSSNVTLIRALDCVLRMFEDTGLEQLYQEIARRARFTREFTLQMGFSLYAQPPANSLTALRVPAGIDSQKFRLRLEEKHHITVMGGQDQAKGKIIRIGHMGHITTEQMEVLMLKMIDVLKEFNPQLATGIDQDQFARAMRGFWRHD